MTDVREAAFDLFRSHGLTTVFGNPGSTELPMLEDFPADFRYVLGLQEMVPAGMADGYAQLTGRPALVQVHAAAGLGGAMGALRNAWWNKTPLIVIAGNQRRSMQNTQCLLTNTDATLFPRPVVKWAAEPATAEELPAVLAHAIHLAQAPPMGPVFVSLPMDDWAVDLDETKAAELRAVARRKVTHGGALAPVVAASIAEQLARSERPALVVGGDVERAGAWDAMVSLAEHCRAPVWTAPFPGLRGFPEDHPLYQGELLPGALWVAGALTGHDLVLVVGAPAFRYYPDVPDVPRPYLPGKTRLIYITSDPDEAARAVVGDAVVADVGLAIEALLAQVPPRDRPAPPRRNPPRVRGSAVAPMHPSQLFAALARVAPPETLWVAEAGASEMPLDEHIRPGRPFSHLTAAGAGLGFGLPASIGAQLATPDRPVAAVIGDGSMHYAVTALWTAATYNIPVTIVVPSSGEYGILKVFGELENITGVPGLDLPALDTVAAAASYGVPAHRANNADELAELFTSSLADRSGPTLIDVPIVKVKEALPGIWR